MFLKIASLILIFFYGIFLSGSVFAGVDIDTGSPLVTSSFDGSCFRSIECHEESDGVFDCSLRESSISATLIPKKYLPIGSHSDLPGATPISVRIAPVVQNTEDHFSDTSVSSYVYPFVSIIKIQV